MECSSQKCLRVYLQNKSFKKYNNILFKRKLILDVFLLKNFSFCKKVSFQVKDIFV